MHRLLVEPETLEMENARLSKENAVHLRVLRPKDGEEFELFDGRGALRVFRWEAKAAQLVASGEKVQRHRGGAAITLFACVTKGQRWDWTIQKATELGTAKIVPVISERTIVRIAAGDGAAKRERWLRIAEDAARQSDAIWLPEICEPVNFRDALALAARTTCFAGALTKPPSPPLLTAIAAELAPRAPCLVPRSSSLDEPSNHQTIKPSNASEAGKAGYSVFIGPEGDFTPQELAELLKIAKPANFGPTILRAETAAIYALSVLAATVNANYEL